MESNHHMFHLPTRAKNPTFFKVLRMILFAACAVNFGAYCLLTTVNEVSYIHAMKSGTGICGWASIVFLVIQGAVSLINLTMLICTLALCILLKRSRTLEARSNLFTLLAYLLGGSFLMSIFCVVAYFIGINTVLDDCFMQAKAEILKVRTIALGISSIIVNASLLIAAINAASVAGKSPTSGRRRRNLPIVFVIASDKYSLGDLPTYEQCYKDDQLPRYSFCTANVQRAP